MFEILAQLCSDDFITNPLKFDSVHYIRNGVKFRGICMESSEQSGNSISETICPTMLVFGKLGLSDGVLLKHPNESLNFRNLTFITSALKLYARAMLYQMSYEATQLGAGQFVGFMCSRERTR